LNRHDLPAGQAGAMTAKRFAGLYQHITLGTVAYVATWRFLLFCATGRSVFL